MIKSFCIDFNWDLLSQAASPGLYAEADPETQVEWMADLGVNCVQTFCVTLNGYAWFPSETHPRQLGKGATFLPRLCEAAQRKNMEVMGYFCLGYNPVWDQKHPKEAHGKSKASGPVWQNPLSDSYLDYFCQGIRESLEMTDIKGFMIDWFRPPVRGSWLDCEIALYNEMMDEKFPTEPIPPELVLEYERRLLDRAWARIHAAANEVRPCTIWTNHPFFRGEEKLWSGLNLLKEVDWVLNEGADLEVIPWLQKQVGPQTKIIQNLCGWVDHKADAVVANLPAGVHGVYGFANAEPIHGGFATTGSPTCEHNARNLPAIRKFYRGE